MAVPLSTTFIVQIMVNTDTHAIKAVEVAVVKGREVVVPLPVVVCTRFLIHQWVLPVDKYSHRPVHQEIGLKKLRLDKVLNYLNYLDSGPNRGGKDQRRLCLIELTTILQVALAQVELKVYLTAQVHCKYLHILLDNKYKSFYQICKNNEINESRTKVTQDYTVI